MSATPDRKKPRKLQKRAGRASVDLDASSAEHDNDEMSRNESMMSVDAEARAVFDRKDSQLPQLPIGEHSYLNSDPSFLLQRSEMASEGESLDERELRRHFMDVESSFLPDPSAQRPYVPQPEQREALLGVDDTYLELGKPGHTPPPDQMFSTLSERRQQQSKDMETKPMEDTSETASAQAAYEGGDEEEEEEEESAELHQSVGSPSSPAAAAARRTHGKNGPAGHARNILVESIPSASNSRPSTPGQRPTSKGSTIKPEYSPGQDDHNGTPKDQGTPRFRPGYLHSRTASQRSLASSATLSSDLSGSDAAALADQWLRGGSSRGQLLSRLPSLGSVTSAIDRDSDYAPSLQRGISNNSVLASMRSARFFDDSEQRPETPRANQNHVEAPTDTVIAQHVQSIQVPETVARDFRARNQQLSPDKRPASSGGQGAASFQGGPRRTLTLKEQNSKIDKLTKENFDLKLKIHFLDQALQSRSDDGVKELIDKNVQFQTDLANERKETQSLRRKMRELERKVKEQEETIAQVQAQQAQRPNGRGGDDDDDDPTLQAEMHEEILYLRQQLDHSENRVTTLSEEVMTKELEKRKMAEHMRSMAGIRGEDTAGMKETMDMWQDLLNAETGRREQAEEDIRKLREELTSLRIERASPAPTKFAKSRSRAGYEDNFTGESDHGNGTNGFESAAILAEQLKHENAELRRDLGAQTSMLTSRNRERERLQQEIEDLKLLQRKSDGARSVAGESIFERSISRAHQRAPSRAISEAPTQVTEAEREDWDKKEGHLRDQNAELRLKFQELERTHGTHLQYVTVLETDYQEMETELNEASEDLRALQTERDEALQAFEEKEKDLQTLEQEALAEIDRLEKELDGLQEQLDDTSKTLQKTQKKFVHTSDGYKGLQSELREITQSVMNLEDEKQANMRTIQTLEEQIAETEDELQKWEQKCKETDQKNRKLEITQESLHSEITFLREEQEGDKIKIGELEDALNAAQQSIQDEQEKLRELEQAMVEERQQRDVLENKSREEVQKVLDDLNSESQKTKDEVRKLRRGLSAKEVEASTWKQKLDELEHDLRSTIGDPDGTKQSLLANIEKLQRDLESTANSLDRAKMDLADRDRLLRHRDGLLESTSLESRRLSDLLDKERASRKHDLDQFDRASRGQATNMRTIAQQESRVLELETVVTQGNRRLANLEQQYRDQLHERNTLLFALWNRLSTLCGTDWAQHHSSVDGEVPSVDVISRRLPVFNKNLLSAVKTLEALLGTFKTRIRSTEKDLWKDYQTLEHNLDMRIRRMDALEQAVSDAQRTMAEEAAQRPQPSRTTSSKNQRGTEEIGKLKNEVKILKAELKFHRQHPSPMAQQMLNQQAQLNPDHSRRLSSGGASGKSTTSPARAIMSQLLRHHSTSAVEQLPSSNDPDRVSLPSRQPPIVLSTPPIQPSEQRWVHRLKEMERRLKAEREARLLDRRGARQRLEEGRLENEELKAMLERERIKREGLEEVGSVAGSERLGLAAEGSQSDLNASSGVD